MDRLRKAAVITRLIEQLRQRGSWCGETHVQKATLFLQDLMLVPLEFEFILYKHGPFSFDLRDELTSLQADELVKLEPQWGYGPRIATTSRSKYIQDLYSKTLGKYEDRICFVAEKLGSRGVADLERLATAFYVTDRIDRHSSAEVRAAKLTSLKPHVGQDEAIAAVREADRIAADGERLLERSAE
jgi:hypothetical protein